MDCLGWGGCICMCTFSKHWQDIRAAPAPGVSALIEDRVKLHRILLPAYKHTIILVIPGAEPQRELRHLCLHSIGPIPCIGGSRKHSTFTSYHIVVQFTFYSILAFLKSVDFNFSQRGLLSRSPLSPLQLACKNNDYLNNSHHRLHFCAIRLSKWLYIAMSLWPPKMTVKNINVFLSNLTSSHQICIHTCIHTATHTQYE